MITAFLATAKRAKWAEGTREMYEQKSRHLARVLGEDTKASRIERAQVNAYIDTRIDEGAASSTVGKELTTLRGILTLAANSGVYTHIVDRVVPEWHADYTPRETYLTREQLEALLAVLPKSRQDYVRFAVASGGRHSELASAMLGDIDTEKGFIFLRSTKTKKHGTGDRFVPITPLTAHLLEGITLPLERWPDGNRGRDLTAASKRAGTPRVTANDLRRTHATWLVQNGVDDGTAGRALGHASAEMVRRVYGRMTPDALRSKMLSQIGVSLVAHENRKRRESTAPNEDSACTMHERKACEFRNVGLETETNRGLAQLVEQRIPNPRRHGESQLGNGAFPETCVISGASVATTRGFSIPRSMQDSAANAAISAHEVPPGPHGKRAKTFYGGQELQ